MTCRISLFKSIRETLKHHIASIFATSLVFFVQFIVFFLNIQNLTHEHVYHSSTDWIRDRLNDMTQPGYGYMVPIVFVAILLAFDFFRYLHSKKQMDFYESLPIRRKKWFCLRVSSSCTVFLIPFTLCIGLEMLLLVVFSFATPALMLNLLWNYVCMLLVFLITWLTTALAMVMTGHPVIAFFGFCVFSVYAPIIVQFLFTSYASVHFKTYAGESGEPLPYLTYISPIGASIKLLGDTYSVWQAASHVRDFIVILVLICVLGLLTYFLFIKRPSEAAGRAMSFEKANPFIRVLLVIPLTLYLGLYLSLVTSIGSKIWMVFGFVIGTVLLHGIIESIFQFDIRGLWSHKKQMICCFAACLIFACIFWFDLLKYDDYLPELDELESIAIKTNSDYYYYNETVESDGISGEYLDDAMLLAQNLVEQDVDTEDAIDITWIQFEYRLKNGKVKTRNYSMDFERNQELFDKLYTTKEYKDDYCALYSTDWSDIKYITWYDSVSEVSLYMDAEKLEHLFETYLAEYTELTYSQEKSETVLGHFTAYYEKENEKHQDFSCYVFPQFTQTIAILDDFIASNANTMDYGSISELLLDKYEIASLEIYFEDNAVSISDLEQIKSLKDQFVLSEYFYKSASANYDYDNYYDGNIGLLTDDGIRYTSVMIPKETAEELRGGIVTK